jgi:hypothetical protein
MHGRSQRRRSRAIACGGPVLVPHSPIVLSQPIVEALLVAGDRAARPVDRRQHVHARLRLSTRRAADFGRGDREGDRDERRGRRHESCGVPLGPPRRVDLTGVEALARPATVDSARRLSQSFDEMVARRVEFLTAYQDAGYADRYPAGDDDVVGPIYRGKCRRCERRGVRRQVDAAAALELRPFHRDEGRTEALQAGEIFWSMVRLRPNSVSKGCTDTQFDFTPQSPQPSQTSSLMTTRLSGSW